MNIHVQDLVWMCVFISLGHEVLGFKSFFFGGDDMPLKFSTSDDIYQFPTEKKEKNMALTLPSISPFLPISVLPGF